MQLKLKLVVMAVIFGQILSSCSSSNKANEHSGLKSKELFDVHKKVLSNGLTVLFVKNEKLPIFSYYTYYKVGGKFESPGITGSSHLLEHMMFKGAKKYGEGQFDQLVEGNGGQNNAYTTNDLTVYYENLPKDHFEITADLEADRMMNLLLAKDSFEKERLVVLEERKMRYENSDNGRIYLELMKEAFKGTPYGISVIGEVSDLKNVTRDQVQKYFKTYYNPNNAVVVIVGDLKKSDVFEQMEKKFGHLPANKNLEKTKTEQLAKLGFNFRSDFKKEIKLKGVSPTPLFMIAYKGLKLGERDAFSLDLLASMLGDGASSYLSEKFVTNKNPKLLNIYAANYTLQESGIFFVGGQFLDKKMNVEKVKKEIIASLSKSCDESLDERSLKKVLNQYLYLRFKDLDTNQGIARFLGDREVYYGDYEFYKKEMGLYESITIDEIKNVCQKYIANKDYMMLTIWNKN